MAQGVPCSLRPRIFLTFRHYKGCRSSAKRTGRLYPRRNPWHSLSEADSTSGHMVLSRVPRKKSPVTPLGIDPGTLRPVAQCLDHYATSGCVYGVSQEERAKLREGVPYVKVYRYNPKQLCPKLNGYGDKGQRKVWSFCGSTYCTWFA